MQAESFLDYARRWLPPGGRVLEVGAGSGKLAQALVRAGHAVVPIDPHPAVGSGVHAVAIEDFQADRRFDAVVAQLSLHHVTDLDAAFTVITDVLDDDGLLVLQEFGWNLLDERTGEWLHTHMGRLGLESAGDAQAFIARWRAERADLATFAQLRARLDRFFHELDFLWIPYLAEEYLNRDVPAMREESELLQRQAISPTAFLYAGRRI